MLDLLDTQLISQSRPLKPHRRRAAKQRAEVCRNELALLSVQFGPNIVMAVKAVQAHQRITDNGRQMNRSLTIRIVRSIRQARFGTLRHAVWLVSVCVALVDDSGKLILKYVTLYRKFQVIFVALTDNHYVTINSNCLNGSNTFQPPTT
ncbi:hypothetical protein DFH09DRAFT_1068653 [Mycena vulgaris]|nr:hypothetical protein DFH09DRAFT_1068653 [Mycena vulgaris]